jgi:hypothetical protein
MADGIGTCERCAPTDESCLSRWAVGKLTAAELCPRCARLHRLAVESLHRLAVESGLDTEQQEQR